MKILEININLWLYQYFCFWYWYSYSNHLLLDFPFFFVKWPNYIVIQQEKGERLSESGSKLDHPFLTKEIAQDIKTLWQDSAIQVQVILRPLQSTSTVLKLSILTVFLLGNFLSWKYATNSWLCPIFHGKSGATLSARLCSHKGNWLLLNIPNSQPVIILANSYINYDIISYLYKNRRMCYMQEYVHLGLWKFSSGK